MLSNVLDTIRTLIVPMQDRNLLLPNVAVAEVMPYTRPRAIDDAPEWLLGSISWRGKNTPLISYDRLNGIDTGKGLTQARIVVFNTVQRNSGLEFYALVTAGIPQLRRVNPDALQEISGDVLEGALSQVQIGEIQAIIPDLDALETAVAATWKQVA